MKELPLTTSLAAASPSLGAALLSLLLQVGMARGAVPARLLRAKPRAVSGRESSRVPSLDGARVPRLVGAGTPQRGGPTRALARLIVIGALLLIATGVDGAVTYPLRWRWSNPAPHGNNIISMAFQYAPPFQRAVQVGERGQIYTSEDLILWTPRESGVTNALRSVTFFLIGQTNRIIITGEAGMVLYGDSVDQFLPGILMNGATNYTNSDWLEGVAASPQLLVAVGDAGSVFTSQNGITWKKQSFGAATDLNGVAWGPLGFVAVGDNGVIGTSVNGTNWNRVNIGTANYNRVSYSAGRYTVVGTGGAVLFNTNVTAFNWKTENCGATNELYVSAQANALTARLIAGSNEVRLLDNGTWTNEFSKGTNGPAPWVYFSAIAQPDFFLLAGRTGMLFEGYKTNGATPYYWIPSTDAFRPWLFDVTHVPGLFVAVGDRGTVMSSGDGVKWELEYIPTNVTNSIFLGVGGSTNMLVAVGSKGSVIYSLAGFLTNVVITNIGGTNISVTNIINSLGVFWRAVEPRFTTNDLQGVCLFSNRVIVTGDNGKVYTSLDCLTWTSNSTPTGQFLSGVTAWPGGLVASGDNGAIVTSPDGFAWSLRQTLTSNWLYRVRYLDGKLIAVGQNGALHISTDGMQWPKQTNSGTTLWLHDVTKIDDTFFLLGKQGLVMTSTNATNWTERGAITLKSFYGAATDGRRLICIGLEGMILRSPVIPDLTPPAIVDYARIQSSNGLSVANLFLFGGQTDQRFTLDYRSAFDTNLWNTGTALEFYDSSGTLIFLETFFVTNAPPVEFYRAKAVP